MSAIPWISVGAIVLVGAMLIGVTVTGRDVWPFSGYPMFSSYRAGPPSQRFFEVYFHFADGRVVPTPDGFDAPLASFQRDFEGVWAGEGARGAATNSVVNALWTRVAELEPALADARLAEVRVTLVQLGAHGGLSLAEKSLGRFERAGRG